MASKAWIESSSAAAAAAAATALAVLAAAAAAVVTEAANVKVTNNCPYTIWPATVNPKGGIRLPHGKTWSYTVAPGSQGGRLWARTNCSFTSQRTGAAACSTGDCGGALVCGSSGAIPATLVEYTLNGADNNDFYDVSLVDGFNVPVSITPLTANAKAAGPSCRAVSCAKELNAVCPPDLKLPGSSDAVGGCRSACAAFPDNDAYCCRGAHGGGPQQCPPSKYATFFKTNCPDAYSYAYDDNTSTFTCPGGATDYDAVFCP